MIPRRPLRSVMLCNPRYVSAYVLGVAQAMAIRGDWHREVSVWSDLDCIARQLDEMRPDVIWTHTIPWSPRGVPSPGWLLLDLLAKHRRRGAKVAIHDGDPRPVTRYPRDISHAVDVALCNHSLPRAEWKIPTFRWPYGAMAQRAIGEPVESLRCGLLFAGIVRTDDSLYSGRSDVLGVLREKLGDKFTVRTGSVNDRMQAADVAPSADAVLGFARPEVPGWVDTRVFQYPGAGGILIHDGAHEFLDPGVHFVEFKAGEDATATANAIVETTWKVRAMTSPMRQLAFEHVQKRHTWAHRVDQAIDLLFGGAS